MKTFNFYLQEDQKINDYHLARHIISFLNNKGGDIYIGLNEQGTLKGVISPKSKKTQIETIIKKRIRPIPSPYINVSIVSDGLSKNVIHIQVSPGKGNYSYKAPHKVRLQDVVIDKSRDFELLFPPKTLHAVGIEYVEMCTTGSGAIVPMFEATTLHGLNQLVGYVKYINKSNFDILYRGENSLHNTFIPSLFRKYPNVERANQKLASLIEKIVLDEKMMKQLHISNPQSERDKYIVESMLQHYGISTHFLDVVDNHWIALWMGLNRWVLVEKSHSYATYKQRQISFVDSVSKKGILSEDLYQYILLFGIPRGMHSLEGFRKNKGFVTIDLREILPSVFLRPHAQHAMLIRKIQQKTFSTQKDFDMSTNLACIIRIRVDRAAEWIGNGKLLTLANLFPSPAYDQGYCILLQRNDLFEGYGETITHYVYD